MKKKRAEDESLVLRADEWQRILSESSLEVIKSIIGTALQQRNALRKEVQSRKEEARRKAKLKSRLRLQEKAEEFRADLIKKQTPSEARFKIILKELDIKYEFQKIFYTENSFYIADFYLSNYNIVIEIDGEYHNTPEQKSKDSKRTAKLIEDIDDVYRIKNETVTNIELTKRIVKEFLVKTKKKQIERRINKHYRK